MDTRSRNTEETGRANRVTRGRPFAAWLSFFLGLTIIGGCLLFALALVFTGGQGLDSLKAPFTDYRDTGLFRERTHYYFSLLFSLANDRSRGASHRSFLDEDHVSEVLKEEGQNLLYGIVVGYGQDAASEDNAQEAKSGENSTGTEDGPWVFGNIDGGLTSVIGPDNMPVLPEGYGYCWYLDGEKVWVLEGGTPVDTDRLDSGYRGLIPNISASSGTDVSKIRVLLAVRDVIVNSVSSLLASYRRFESRYPWQKRMLRRIYALLGAEALIGFLVLCFIALSRSGWGPFFAILLTGVGVYLLLRYLRGFDRTITDWGRLMDHICRIRNGDMETRLDVAPDSDIAAAARDLSGIQEGISLAVSEKVKSERMKVELITNVSHDLKTPLTSIVSYIDLLAQEDGMPERAKEYVGILAQKAERLKNLIQDLFELSKAASNDITLDMERIDLVRLMRQVFADMEEPINNSGLAFRINLPDEPVFAVSDGGKLYRVFQNLISNALKYSLKGSRVFVELVRGEKEATVVIKNTANYEMDFTADEILQRFTRGDRSRSTEGSGLGLSIAKSFTEACGGRFGVTIDGDQFKAQVTVVTER